MRKTLHRFLPVCAFLLAIICFLLFLLFYDVLGYGNYTILRGDLYVQYVDFIRMFLRVLKGEEDFWYSFSIYYGSGTILTYAYYAFSPFNLLYLIEAVSVPAMTIAIICIKIGLSAATFSIFARRVLKSSAPLALFFSLCYAMNAFSVTLHFNIIWLEAVYMLPLLMLLIFRLLESGRFLALVPAWVYLFLTNFYMAYIVGVFAALCFIALLILRTEQLNKGSIKNTAKLCTRFAASVILAAGCCAAILLPCALFLSSHMAADNFEFSPLPTTVFELANSLFIGSVPDIDNRSPFLYCGLPVLLILPFYFSCRSFSLRERILSGLLMLFYSFGMTFLPLFIALHAFDYPNFYFFRFSFCLCFMFCALACRRLSAAPLSLPLRPLFFYIIGLILFYSFMISFGPLNSRSSDVNNSVSELAVNAAFLLLWGLLYFFLNHLKEKALLYKAALAFSFILLAGELTLNGYISMKHLGLLPISEEDYNSWYNAQREVLDSIPADDTSPYRVAMYGDNNYNSPAFFGYAGFNTFSSSDDYELRQALYGLGISGTNRSITENGYTDLTYMLFGTGYTGSIVRNEPGAAERHAQLTAFQYRLPIAYAVSEDVYDYAAGDDPFENNEALVKAMTGHSYHFFDRLSQDELEMGSYNAGAHSLDNNTIFYRKTDYMPTASLTFSVQKTYGRPFLACFRQNIPSADATAPYVLSSKEAFAVSTTLSQGCIFAGEDMGDTERVAIYFNNDSSEEYPCGKMYFAHFDPEQLGGLQADLSAGGLSITDYRSSSISGTVNVTADRPVLFTSIPYDSGWTAMVDGSPASCEPIIDGAFLSLRLSPGSHEINLSYKAPGAFLGLTISLLSLFTSLVIWLISRNNAIPLHSQGAGHISTLLSP